MKFDFNLFFIKLTSRKFWLSAAGLITSIIAFFHCNQKTIVQVTTIITAYGSVIGYLVANELTEDVSKSSDQMNESGN